MGQKTYIKKVCVSIKCSLLPFYLVLVHLDVHVVHCQQFKKEKKWRRGLRVVRMKDWKIYLTMKGLQSLTDVA